MNRATILAMAMAIGTCGAASGSISVQLEIAPTRVWSFEPVLVLYSVQNAGPVDVVLPVDLEGEMGYLEYREAGTDAWYSTDLAVAKSSGSASRADHLAPGQSRLALVDAGYHFGPEGRYDIRVRIWSGGECIVDRASANSRGDAPEDRRELVSCTPAQLESEVAVVEVVRPSSEYDRQAWEFLGRPKRLPFVFAERFKELVERYPRSRYTYGAAFRANRFEDAIRLQPENPLNSSLAAYLAGLRLLLRKCCDLPDPAPETARVLALLPTRLRQYVSQQEQRRLARCTGAGAEPCAQGTGKKTPPGERVEAASSDAGAHEQNDISSASHAQAHRSNSWTSSMTGVESQSVGTFSASMGFKQRLLLSASPSARVHWLSLPYVYEPLDVGTLGVVDAEDLCQDAGEGGGVSAVLRWNEATSTIVEHLCGNPSPFALLEGLAYGIRRLPNWSLSANLAGGHDDAFTHSIPATGGSQLSWISVPYHIKDAGNQSPVTAEGLCQQVGSSEVLAIVRFDSSAGSYRAYGCGSAFESPFPIAAGEGFGVINRGSQTISWQPIHY